MSVKAKAVQAAAVMAGFLAFLAEVGAERDASQLAKSRWALDCYAEKATKNPRARPASKRLPPRRSQSSRHARAVQ